MTNKFLGGNLIYIDETVCRCYSLGSAVVPANVRYLPPKWNSEKPKNNKNYQLFLICIALCQPNCWCQYTLIPPLHDFQYFIICSDAGVSDVRRPKITV